MNQNGVYAIGDIQGCFTSFMTLLDKGPIDLDRDQLWLVGDLVNRGPQSLETLRAIKSLALQMGDRLKVVLGNHDLHLLALAHGIHKTSAKPELNQILTAKDKIDLLEWLRHCPLLFKDKQTKAVLVHAGIHPRWRIKQAASYAREVEVLLQGKHPAKLLKKMYGKRPTTWSHDLEGWPRYRFIINTLTRMRYCTRKGGLNFSHTGPPGSQSKKWYPWYQLPLTPRKNWRIVFGHWASAGAWFDGNHIALDSGCVWGQSLTMARIDTRKVSFHQISCAEFLPSHSP